MTASENPLCWSLVLDGASPGARNMARDHALAEALDPGRGVLRLYRWTRPTLSFGRNEPALELYDRDAVERGRNDVVRRPTGGRAVFHHHEVTYAAVTPLRALGGVRESYRLVNAALVRGLAELGVTADIAPGPSGERAAPVSAGPCFREPAEGEVTVEGRKLVGSAQARIGRGLLQHGSILLDDDQDVVERLVRSGGREPASRPATLGHVMGSTPGPNDVADAVVAGFRAVMGGRWDGVPPDTADAEERLVEERYAREEWTWRR